MAVVVCVAAVVVAILVEGVWRYRHTWRQFAFISMTFSDLKKKGQEGGGEGELDIYFIQECILYVPWPIGAMPLRVSDFHFPNSNFHSLALALAPIVHGNTVVDTFPSPTPSPSPGT